MDVSGRVCVGKVVDWFGCWFVGSVMGVSGCEISWVSGCLDVEVGPPQDPLEPLLALAL